MIPVNVFDPSAIRSCRYDFWSIPPRLTPYFMVVPFSKVLVGHLPTRGLLLRGLGVRPQAVLNGPSCVLRRRDLYPGMALMAGPRDAYTLNGNIGRQRNIIPPPLSHHAFYTGGDCNAYHARRPACSGWITALPASRREQSRRGLYLGHILDPIGWSSGQIRRYGGRRVRLKWAVWCP